MTIDILMPALSPTMTEGTLLKWHVKEGDAVVSGDILAEIETDKATMEVEAVDEGTLAKILIAEGTENVKVNTPIAVIASDGEDISAGDIPATAPVETQVQPLQQTPAAPATPAATPVDDPEVPQGTEMVATTMREALRDAMAEEMRKDKNVFIMGE